MVLKAALHQFEAAVKMDTDEAFESHFQYAKALKEGSHLVAYLQSKEDGNEYHHNTFIL
jgi:hypothetical protein